MEPESERILEAEVRDEKFSVKVVAAQCTGCKRVILSGKGRKAYNRAATDAYRAKHNLLTVPELNTLRRNLGMTWTQFAAHVGVGIATLKRWLAGEIQSPTYDEHVRLKADLNFVRRMADELLVLLSKQSTTYYVVENFHVSDDLSRYTVQGDLSRYQPPKRVRQFQYANDDYAIPA